MPELYAQVILPLSLHDSYTYKVPESMQKLIAVGQRVVVQFGKQKMYAALVISLSENSPAGIPLKEIQQILDEQAIVLPNNLKLWTWMADYYCCHTGDIFRAALPSGLKLESQSQVGLTDVEYQADFNEKEKLILEKLAENESTVFSLQKALGNNFAYSALKSLLHKNLIYLEEKVSIKYRPKEELFIKLNPEIKSESILNSRIDGLKRAKKQRELLIHFCDKTRAFDEGQLQSIQKKELLRGTTFSSNTLKELVKKNILLQVSKRVSRIDETAGSQVSINLLNKYQEKALTEIKACFKNKQVVLIHGITASGKTEIYIHLIAEVLKSGKQALYLVPEIALTTQIVQRLKAVFGNKVGIYHSKLNSQERVEVWEKTLLFNTKPGEGYQVILGARSALFLPFSALGLIIVDEEHENSYKQFDPAPRYNARDMAVILASQNKAKVLLGSATPSFESYYNSLTGKYGLVNLFRRHTEVELPEFVIADVKRAYKKKQMHSILTPQLYTLMQEALSKNEQIILFQNRRGFSPFVECFTCGHIPACKKCDVSLTYHKYKKQLVCHYCGYHTPFPERCDECGSPEIKTRGFGTEKIEVELKPLFRNARFARMDMDSTQTKNAFRKIVHNLEQKRTDILIGTQMVTKGLDFENISVVGILNADNLINFPDFRAHERAYQLISQVSGRAGRKYKRGKVVIQTSQPEHPLIQKIINQNYAEWIKEHLEERGFFKYPPLYRLIKVIVKHKNPETVGRVSNQLATSLKNTRLFVVLGPEFPLVSRVKLWYIKEIWLKYRRNQNSAEIKIHLKEIVKKIKEQPGNSNIAINIDVDPY